MLWNSKEFKFYNYLVSFKGVKFGTFLKDPPVPLISELAFADFLEEFSRAFKVDHVYFCRQIHSNQVHAVRKIASSLPKEGDGLITKLERVALMGFHADCQIAFFFDLNQKVIGLAHAGFRGQILKIYTKILQQMVEEFQCCYRDIQVVFSPSLGVNHSQFVNYLSEFPPELWSYRNHQGHFDLKKMAADELISMGISQKNIYYNPSCTFEEESKFYSYRKTKTSRRHISYIFLEGAS